MSIKLPRRRVIDVWNWLPAFRTVAEAEHVHRAARAEHVTPSSLSRSLGLLEEHLGRKLLDRVGRNVKLNAEGETLLAAVRDAMRRIDDAIDEATGTALSGELHLACDGDQPLDLAWRAATRLMARYPALTTKIEPLGSNRDLTSRLLRGELDAVLMTTPPRDARLAVERLGDVRYGIYCGVGHALYGRRNPDWDTIAEHAFVAPCDDEHGPGDQWPAERPRRVTLRLPALAAAIAVCEAGELLAVLPDDAATRAMRRLPSDFIPPSALFVVWRKRPGSTRPAQSRDDASAVMGKADAFVAELRATAPRAPRPPSAGPRRPAERSTTRRSRRA